AFEQPPPHEGFRILHAGALYYGRSLRGFLDAMTRLSQTDPKFASRAELTLIGTLDAAAEAELTGHRVEFRGHLDHPATLEAMRAADLLLLVANTTHGAEATVPGKVFEYLATGRPILAIAPSEESSTADVLSQTRGGRLVRADDEAQITCALREAF